MWSAVIPALNLALVWIFVVSIAFLLVKDKHIDKLLACFNHPLLILLLVALISRLIPLIMLPVGAGYDIDSFRLVGEALIHGEDVYTSAAVGRHPYFPMQMYAIGAATQLAKSTPIPFIIWIKLPALLADLLIVFFIFKSFTRWGKSESESTYYTLFYALNPISILVTAYHGQFDAIPVLLLLLSWFSWHFGRHVTRSALLLGFAILNKTWPVVLFPITFIRLPNIRQRVSNTVLSFGIPIFFTTAYVLFFDSNPIPMLRRSLTHSGVPGYWGLSTLIHIPGGFLFESEQALQLILPWQRIFMICVALIILWWTRHQDALNALLTMILTVFAIMLGMGLQWLLWPVAFAVLAREIRWLKWYTITSTLMILVHLYGLHLHPWLNQLFEPEPATIILRLVSLPVWLVIIFWVFNRLRRSPTYPAE